MYSAQVIAQYIIWYSQKECIPITNLKLQKLLYFIQGECIRVLGKPAFNEAICAWKLGPVVPEVYFEFSHYAGSPILQSFDRPEIDQDIRTVIDFVLIKKLDLNAWTLVSETHLKGSPWDAIYNGDGNSDEIPIEMIKEYFRTRRN